jgi:hypothetical protein
MAGDELVVLVVVIFHGRSIPTHSRGMMDSRLLGSVSSFWLSLLLECATCELCMQGSFGASKIANEQLMAPELIVWWQIE